MRKFPFLKYKDFFRGFHIPKFKGSFFLEPESSVFGNIRNFLILELESSIS